MVGRSIARAVIFAAALALGWIGYLGVGSWEASDATTRAGAVLIVGALIATALVAISFMRDIATTSLWAAVAISVLSWTLAVLID